MSKADLVLFAITVPIAGIVLALILYAVARRIERRLRDMIGF